MTVIGYEEMKMVEKFEYWQSKKNGQWYFHLKTANGEIIAQSQGYTTKDNCINGIRSIKNNANTADYFETTEEE
jgi:uncharacterized protein YegP (UPF0339 family)